MLDSRWIGHWSGGVGHYLAPRTRRVGGAGVLPGLVQHDSRLQWGDDSSALVLLQLLDVWENHGPPLHTSAADWY